MGWLKKKAKSFKRKVTKEAKKVANKVSKTSKKNIKKAAKEVSRATKKAARRSKRVIKNTLEGSLRGQINLVRTVSGIATDVGKSFQKDFFKGLMDLGKNPLEIIEAATEAGAATLGITFANFIEIWGGRKLTKQEKAEARKIFGKSMPLGEIRIATSVPVKAIHKINNGRPFTSLRLICYKSKEQLKRLGMRTLIHELAHVWQYQKTGPVYIVGALKAQAIKGKKAYKVTEQMLKARKGKLKSFNPEQQATIIENYWLYKWGPVKSRDPEKAALYEPYARKVYR